MEYISICLQAAADAFIERPHFFSGKINIAGTGALLRIYTHADCHFKNLREIRLLYKVF